MERLLNRQFVQVCARAQRQLFAGTLPGLSLFPRQLTNFAGTASVLRHHLTPCPACEYQRQAAAAFHMSSIVGVAKRKNQKKKIVKPIQFTKKSAENVIPIQSNMTVSEVASALNVDEVMYFHQNDDASRELQLTVQSGSCDASYHVFEVLLYIPGTDHYDKPDTKIDDLNVIKEIVRKCGHKFRFEEKKKKQEKENKDVVARPPADPALLQRRPPVVTIMGHVDHGKTTLLDCLRHSHIVDAEFGGITQHIGAFSVKLSSGEGITFLDTPGHAAFFNMRARGANVTDIVVLVVAADDGVMKQTAESAMLAKEANVPIIVALNKIDKPDSDLEMAKRSLMELDIVLEEFGGDVQAVPISALKGTNVEELQEAIVTLAEVLEIKGDPTGPVEAVVIESRTDIGRGKLSTALIQRGTLKKGAVLVAGTAWAKVRSMFNDSGRPVMAAGPGTAVEIIGWRELPSAGDEIIQVESEHRAHEVLHWRVEQQKLAKIEEDAALINEKAEQHQQEYRKRRQEKLEKGQKKGAIYRRERTKEVIEMHNGPELAIVLKGDVDGTVEAILDILESYYSSDQCRLHLLHYGVGPVTENDLDIAKSFDGVVYAFNVPLNPSISKAASSRGVSVREHNIIYKMFNELKDELSAKLPPEDVEDNIGEANVLQSFTITEGKKKIHVAGCRCVKGSLQRKKYYKLIRDGEVILDGRIASLRHFKNEVESVKTGVECGICFGDMSVDPQLGDTVICYDFKQVSRTIKWELDF